MTDTTQSRYRGRKITRRTALKLTAGGAAMGLASPALSQGMSDKLLVGVPSSLSTPYGVADDTDYLNGTNLALEDINAAGGILGREVELFVPDVDKLSPESCRQAIAACIDKKVHAISNAFLFAPIPAMDESAKYKCPYLNGIRRGRLPRCIARTLKNTAICCRQIRRR